MTDPSTTPQPQRIDLMTLTIPQLQQMKQQLEGETQTITASCEALYEALERYNTSLGAIKALNADPSTTTTLGREQHQPLLIPLSSSMYAYGRLDPKTKGRVTMDLGTGFFAKMSNEEGQRVMERKINYIEVNLNAFQEQLRQKNNTISGLTQVIQAKIQDQLRNQPSLAGSTTGVSMPRASSS